MRQTTGTRKSPGEKLVKDIKRATRKQYSSEEKIRIVLDGLRGEDSIAELCRREPLSRFVAIQPDKNRHKLNLNIDSISLLYATPPYVQPHEQLFRPQEQQATHASRGCPAPLVP